eukprot:CAMPEP_0118647724 /NCGR_PEP_ID=MMETSP0785-20121206/8764_1 /TAXON_ID=91992 /ORGANISM="Bolidomonas pacifica, Strain CCMP 1866" /LENGTH=463 /DNA_ID=CAMNT_0006539847 /DNA_START=913 /DNA_END=2304 /DNA_ORIENTATION=-
MPSLSGSSDRGVTDDENNFFSSSASASSASSSSSTSPSSTSFPPIHTGSSIARLMRRASSSFSAEVTTFESASSFHLNASKSKGARRSSTVALLDESEHGVGKCRRRRSLSEPTILLPSPTYPKSSSSHASILANPQSPSNTDCVVSWDALTDVRFYREGSFSLIFEARLKDRPVMVKLLKSDHMFIDEHAAALFSQEVDLILDNLSSSSSSSSSPLSPSSPYLIDVISRGPQAGPSSPPSFLVMEKLAENLSDRLTSLRANARGGILRSLSWKKTQPSSSWESSLKCRLTTVLQIATALAHCHTLLSPSSCVVHRDVNPSNIGFRKDGTAVLFDFNNAKLLKNYDATGSEVPREMTGDVGNLRYQSPEMSCHNPTGSATDVHSFAILAWEIASMQVPYGESLSTNEYLLHVVEGGDRPVLTDKIDWPSPFRNLLSDCWSENQLERPHMVTVTEAMHKIIENM